jgi:Arc/MetJ-type ribon-helix-helix transcriptional regulator
MLSEMTVKLNISLPDELALEARAAVRAGRAPSMSAYIAMALEAFPDPPTLAEILDEVDAQFGRTSPDVKTWAEEQLGFGNRADDGDSAK